MSSIHAFGTAVLHLDLDRGCAIIAIPATWDGQHERDMAAAQLFLCDAGLPADPEVTVEVEADGLEVHTFTWSDASARAREPRGLERLRADAHGCLVPSELRDAVNMALRANDSGESGEW